ncbi:MAG: tyrosine-type recombinase/integrase [Fibrobacteres bacterium]|nr:tyrosine-type recombinase/integrase [Fibrobacterota bacterium]
MKAPNKEHGCNLYQTGRNTWHYDARVIVRGREFRKRGVFTGSKDEATAYYLALKKALRAETNSSLKLPICSIKNFKDILLPYKKELDLNNSLSRSHKALIDYVERELGDRPLKDFSESLQRYLEVKEDQIIEFQRKKFLKIHPEATEVLLSKLPYKPHLRNRIVQVCRAAYNIAIKKKLVTSNPITSDAFPKRKEMARKDIRFDAITEQRLLNAVKDKAPYLLPIVKFSLLVPCRKNELVYATKSDIDFEKGILIIPEDRSKNGDIIRKYIPESFKDYFRNLPSINEYIDGRQYLFYRRRVGDNMCLPLGDFKRAWKACLKAAGIKELRFHDLRHISASRMAQLGNSVRLIMSTAGWKNDMLGTYYSEHVDNVQPVYADSSQHGRHMDSSLSIAI